jgi:hypothetical protein
MEKLSVIGGFWQRRQLQKMGEPALEVNMGAVGQRASLQIYPLKTLIANSIDGVVEIETVHKADDTLLIH